MTGNERRELDLLLNTLLPAESQLVRDCLAGRIVAKREHIRDSHGRWRTFPGSCKSKSCPRCRSVALSKVIDSLVLRCDVLSIHRLGWTIVGPDEPPPRSSLIIGEGAYRLALHPDPSGFPAKRLPRSVTEMARDSFRCTGPFRKKGLNWSGVLNLRNAHWLKHPDRLEELRRRAKENAIARRAKKYAGATCILTPDENWLAVLERDTSILSSVITGLITPDMEAGGFPAMEAFYRRTALTDSFIRSSALPAPS